MDRYQSSSFSKLNHWEIKHCLSIKHVFFFNYMNTKNIFKMHGQYIEVFGISKNPRLDNRHKVDLTIRQIRL